MRYFICAGTLLHAQYIKKLLYVYGYNYGWELVVDKNINQKTVKIQIIDNVFEYQTASADQAKMFEVTITTDERELESKGIKANKLFGQTGYCIKNIKHLQSANPLPVITFVGLDANDNWEARLLLFLSGSDHRIQKFAITTKRNGNCYLVIGMDIVHFIEILLSSDKGYDDDNWGDAFGHNQEQSLADIPTFDILLNDIFQLMQTIAPGFLPITIGFFPPGKTAPLIITGDTDYATSDELKKYAYTLNDKNLKASLMFMGFDKYACEILGDIQKEGNSIGIHPYSPHRLAKEYEDSFNSLVAEGENNLKRIIGVRNHFFQRIDDVLTFKLAAKHNIHYDFNCVASSENSWIGTGSGIGLPIPIPYFFDVMCPVFHFPTIIEDDVFIYDYDYCYKSFITGVFFSDDVCIDYLHQWLFNYMLPCAINLHPEHIRSEHRFVLDRILNWASVHKIWAPSLDEYDDWQNTRESANIKVQDGVINVNIQKPIIVKRKNGKAFTLSQSGVINLTNDTERSQNANRFDH